VEGKLVEIVEGGIVKERVGFPFGMGAGLTANNGGLGGSAPCTCEVGVNKGTDGLNSGAVGFSGAFGEALIGLGWIPKGKGEEKMFLVVFEGGRVKGDGTEAGTGGIGVGIGVSGSGGASAKERGALGNWGGADVENSEGAGADVDEGADGPTEVKALVEAGSDADVAWAACVNADNPLTVAGAPKTLGTDDEV